MSFEKRMQDLRNYLDIEDALSTKTEQLMQAVELEHAKALPKKREAKKVVEVQRFSVSITEQGETSICEFENEKSLNAFLVLKQKTRAKYVYAAVGAPHIPNREREREGELLWMQKVDEKCGSFNVKISAL